VKLPVTPSPAPLLSLKSMTPKRFCDRMDFGIFQHAAHLWNPTHAFQKTNATPNPTQTSAVATVVCKVALATSSPWPAQTWLGLTLRSASMSSFLALHTWRQVNTFNDISVTLGMSHLEWVHHLHPWLWETKWAVGMDGRRLSWRHWCSPLTHRLHPHDERRTYLLEEPPQRQCLFVYFRSRIRYCKPSRVRGHLIFMRHSRILTTNKTPPLKSIKTIWHV